MGGEYTDENVILVEITGCNTQTANHVMWHYANWQLWGKEEDRLAWIGLSGFYGKEEIIHEKARLGGQISGAAMRDSGKLAEIGKAVGKIAMSEGGWLYENRVEYGRLGYKAGIGKPENRLSSKEQSELAKRIYADGKGLAAITPEDRVEISKRAGKVSGEKFKREGIGVCGIPPEEHAARMAVTNKQKWKCPECEFVSNAREVNRHMNNIHGLSKEQKVKL
jgi:hypothetical protein